MSGAQIDPAIFGPCSGLALDARDNPCTNHAAEYVEFAPEQLRDCEGVFATGRTTRRLCKPCADAAPDVMSRQPLTTRPGGYPIEQAAPRPTHEVDKVMADAGAAFTMMVESYRRSKRDLNIDPAVAFVVMTKATVAMYDLVEAAELLSVAIARYGDLPDALPTVPAGPHAVATIAMTADGSGVAVCVCTAAFVAEDEDSAASALDAHIADPAGQPARIGTIARGEILAWLNAEPRHFTDVMGMLWCATVTEVGGKPVEAELVDGSHVVVVDGVWQPKAGA